MSLRLTLLLLACISTGSIQGSQAGSKGTFGTVTITLRPSEPTTAIAAYQLEVIESSGRARLVGIEGGAAPFDAPPHYDPAALQPATSGSSDIERVILAAYSLEPSLSVGAPTVATLHYWVVGSSPVTFTVRDLILVDPDGRRVSGRAPLTLEGFPR